MPVPDVVVIGAQKAATTGLYRSLATHPDVVALDAQEAGALHRGPAAWTQWLEKREPHLPARTDAPLVVKLATAMYFEDTLQTIATLNPAAKVVAVLRHPVDRMLSLHRYAVQRGLESRPTEAALRSDVVQRASAWRLRGYSGGSRYADAIEAVRNTFEGSALFLDFDDVHRGTCFGPLEQFLGLTPGGVHQVRANESHEPRSTTLARATASPALQRVARTVLPSRFRSAVHATMSGWNTTEQVSAQAPIPAGFRAELVERHAADVRAAEEAVGKDLPAWHH